MAGAEHLRLATIDGTPVRRRRTRRAPPPLDLSTRLLRLRLYAESEDRSAERLERILKLIWSPEKDDITLLALGREALIEHQEVMRCVRNIGLEIGPG